MGSSYAGFALSSLRGYLDIRLLHLSPVHCDFFNLEGADSIVTLKHLERSYEKGLRAVGPAHYGPGVYANGTDATGDLALGPATCDGAGQVDNEEGPRYLPSSRSCLPPAVRCAIWMAQGKLQ